MENKKYVLLKEDTKQIGSRTLYRIKALVAIGPLVAAGDLGGYIESESNLWVFGDAWVSGDARVESSYEIQWFSNVGSENKTLTVYKTKNSIEITRGCFQGTMSEFESTVKENHGDSKIGRHYMALIQSIKIWFDVE